METSNLSIYDTNTSNYSEEDIQKLQDMLSMSMEIQNKYTDTDEYKQLYARAKAEFPDMPQHFIEVALFAYLEDTHNPT